MLTFFCLTAGKIWWWMTKNFLVDEEGENGITSSGLSLTSKDKEGAEACLMEQFT
jgi:hypothetical protein